MSSQGKKVEVLPLAELLRRSHRDELLPLASALSVNPDGLGLGTLASILERTLRRAGGHTLANLILRRGEGPSYPKVLAHVAHRIDVATEGLDDEDAEQALASAVIRTAWERLEPEGRSRAWALLGMDGEAPTNGRRAVDVASSRLGRATGYKMAGVLAGGAALRFASVALLPFAAPFGALSALWYLGRPRMSQLLPVILEVASLRQIVRHRLTIGVIGSPSSGKDAALRSLFGVDTGNINPIAGSTREVTILRLPRSTALYLVNTPGLGDVLEAVSEEARQILDHIDLYIYVVNAQGGVQAREKADWDKVVATGRPCLAVVNKVDTLRERDRERYMDDARQKLGVAKENFLSAAFDPLPQLAPGPIGVRPIHDWLAANLTALGKDPTELPSIP